MLLVGFWVRFCRLLIHFFALLGVCSGRFWGWFRGNRAGNGWDGLTPPPPPFFGVDEQVITEELQWIGDHFIDAIPSRNPEGKTAEQI